MIIHDKIKEQFTFCLHVFVSLTAFCECYSTWKYDSIKYNFASCSGKSQRTPQTHSLKRDIHINVYYWLEREFSALVVPCLVLLHFQCISSVRPCTQNTHTTLYIYTHSDLNFHCFRCKCESAYKIYVCILNIFGGHVIWYARWRL